MRLPLDEHLSRTVARALRDAGHDVRAAVEDLRGSSDIDLLVIAREEERVLVTRDRDFSRHIFRDNAAPPVGVIYLRIPPLDPALTAELLIRILVEQREAIPGNLMVISPAGIRFRPLRAATDD